MATEFRKSHILALIAVLILVLYILGMLGIVVLPRNAYLIPFMALGPLGVIGSMELGRYLAGGQSTTITRSGSVFGAIAFALWEVVVTVQNGTRVLWQDFIIPDLQANLQGGSDAVRLLYRGVNAIQATVDVSFDIFYCLAIILFSFVMLTDARFGRLIGGVGILSGGGLLILNLWTFPRPPAEAGLFDLGPLTAMWWILVIFAWVRADRAN